MTAAQGKLDGLALGELVHGGDLREALDEPGPYESEGAEEALLLVDRSRRRTVPPTLVRLPDREVRLEPQGRPGRPGRVGHRRADLDPAVRRPALRPDPVPVDRSRPHAVSALRLALDLPSPAPRSGCSAVLTIRFRATRPVQDLARRAGLCNHEGGHQLEKVTFSCRTQASRLPDS
jgi:hypothetical protein